MKTIPPLRFLAILAMVGLGGDARADGAPQREKSSKPEPTSHCTADEKVVFSCPVKGQKFVSVCATKDLSDKTGSLIYRFGKMNQVEMTLPKSADGWRDTVRAGNVMYAGGGGTYLGFKSNEYTYVVYGAFGRGWGTKNGLMVMKNEEEFRVHRCTREPYFKLTHDLFEKAGLEIEDNKIQLPMP
jgi:hypothetical protein